MSDTLRINTSAPVKNMRAGKVPTWKRALDVTCIVAASPLLIPVMVGISIGIKLVSRGPVFFKQERVGMQGGRFTCLKFRSMQAGTGTVVHQNYFEHLVKADVPMTKMDEFGDRRLIRCGALLRSTGLDELPQLINVLRGEMSLVGPRPCTVKEYETCFQQFDQGRFQVLPGLTGLWQVSGKNSTTFSKMIELDVRYAANQSLALDLKIMFKTLPVLMKQTKQFLQKRLGQNPAGGQDVSTVNS